MKRKLDTGLTPKQEQAALMLAAGLSVTATAASIGMDRATVSQWQNISEFDSLVAQERQEMMAATHGKMMQLAQKATATLERLVDSKNERIALSAALGVLQNLPLAAKAESDRRNPLNLFS